MTENTTHTAVVTGAASGMGRATTELLLDHGWTVIALDLNELDYSADALLPAAVDITDRDAVETALADALHDSGRIDLVANIAGVFPPSTLDTFTEKLYRLTFDVNVLGTLNVIAASRPYLGKGSAVVNFASVDAFTVSPGQLIYGATKAAVVMLTKELALELAPSGIRVNAIAPGWVDTPGNAATGRMAEAAKSVPLGRVAQPVEIARWVEMIGGEDAAFLSGETIVLSGADVMR
ncbi:SDR family NAD(P)-dependent oxidoreductase [Corynebacterium sp.]|jgi:NAD(P)-dependent dehydrogenase (short-subunit alcohol dehydrogenase family)|uniref:SDR family NAD(P)-dependent oxidoreductase n=1 Tax=Corynebacterium sp. TaxID=1720 RepID=UPI0025BC9A8D|nr:SDR family oxidoreductase [Corynebacterium sp.]